uniref:RNA-binding protein 42 n=1 Tax=Panagrellus redivivus TaxID=6233 RepID=A0A7E4VJH8_PANRE
MADLDAELALFEQEIASLEAAPTAADVDTTTDQPAVIKNEANFVVVDSPASRKYVETPQSSGHKSEKVFGTQFVPAQVRAKYEGSATISEAPALYNHAKNGNSGAGGSAALDKPPEPPSNLNYMQALPADIELVANKRLNSTAYENSYIGQVLRGEKKMKRFVRTAGGQTWEDPSLAEWDPNDFRVFCGDLGNEVSDELLAKAFRKYPSFQKAKVVRDSRTNKSKGYGFVSFRCQDDFVQACREMDGKYVGNRPIKLRKSNHKDRDFHIVRKKTKQKQKLGLI